MSRKKNKEKNRAAKNGVASFSLLDIEGLDANDYEKAVKTFEIRSKPRLVKCQLLIVGGGCGGVAAALAALDAGLSVCILEESSWLGGQITSQAVSALDENKYVETSGATKTYKSFRQRVRNHYKSMGAKEGLARFEPYLDPGNCWVSRLAFEPKVAIKVLNQMLSPFIASGKLRIFLRHKAYRVKVKLKKIRSLQCLNLESGKAIEFSCRVCIDASELGDILALSGIDYAKGAESRSETGEAHAPEIANPENLQDFTYPFLVEFVNGASFKIAKPPSYDEFNKNGKFSLLSYRMFEDSEKMEPDGKKTKLLPFWEYRRLIARENFPKTSFANDIAMINWESNDLQGENIIDQEPAVAAGRLARGKNLSLGFLYWLQNEAQRDDGQGKGYPELKLRKDMVDTDDGLSKYPYIRESRRIKALRLIKEEDISAKSNPQARARLFQDSLGIGHYPIDIHGKEDVEGAAQASKPFQIPASSMIQKQIRNLLPACKNIGCTHITNGAYRLHPIEWAIGEAAGAFAAELIDSRRDSLRIFNNKRALRKVQKRLLEYGAPLFWYDDLSPEDPAFAAIQYLSICRILEANKDDLHFNPQASLTRAELVSSLFRLLENSAGSGASSSPGLIHDPDSKPELLFKAQRLHDLGLIKKSGGSFLSEEPLRSEELLSISRHSLIAAKVPKSCTAIVSRADYAVWLYKLASSKRFFGRH